MSAAATVGCAAGPFVGCVVAGIALATYNASVMLSQGASVNQVVAVNGIGIVAGMLGGAGAQWAFGQSAAAAMVGGAGLAWLWQRQFGRAVALAAGLP